MSSNSIIRRIGRTLLFTSLIPGIGLASGIGIQTTPLEKRTIRDDIGRDVSYYISRPKGDSAPLLLMIQGSGCASIINPQPGGVYSTLFNLVPFAREGQFTVIAVEKPHSMDPAGKPSGSAQSCSAEFNEDFTAERWLIALKAALDDARRSPWVDRSRTLVVGISEGAVMAALLARQDSRVTDVVSIGGSGTTQLFDFVALAYRRCFDVSPCLSEIENHVREINASPSSSTRFAWGHPYKRWASFFRVDPGEELLRGRARVYLAFGTADESVPALSQEIIAAKLIAAARDITIRRVPNAGHALMRSGSADYADLDKELRAALGWFWSHRGK